MKIHLCVSLLICVSSIHARDETTTPYPTTCCPTGDHYTCHCNHDSDCCESGAFCWDGHCIPQPTTLPPPTTTTPGCVESGEYCGYDDNVDCCEWYDSCLNGYCQQHPTTPPAPSTTASTEACAAEGQYCNHDSECCDWWCHENKCQCCGTSPWYTTTTPPPPSTTTTPTCSWAACNQDLSCCDGGICSDNYCIYQSATPETRTELYTTCTYGYCTHDSGCCDGGICSDNYCTYPTSPAPTPGCVGSGEYCGYDDNIDCCEWYDSCLNGYCQHNTPAPSTTAPPPAGCSYLLLTTGADYPDSALTCYDSQGEEVARSVDTQVVGTVIISMISDLCSHQFSLARILGGK